jgi:hypothetical protein
MPPHAVIHEMPDIGPGPIELRATIVAVEALPAGQFPRCATLLRKFVDWIFGPLKYRVETRSQISLDGQLQVEAAAWRHVGQSFGCCFHPIVFCCREEQPVSPAIAAAGDEFLSSVRG